MKLALLQWRSPCSSTTNLSHFIPFGLSIHPPKVTFPSKFRPLGVQVSSAIHLNCLEKGDEKKEEEYLTARDKRRLRNERRLNSEGINWRERVEERLIKKPKKRYASWTEELNLDTLAVSGPEWWAVRVSRVTGQETLERTARLLPRSYPDVEFKLYNAVVQVKRKLKNGSTSVKAKALFPGCIFLHCVLNKELHDFIREVEGVGGFIGSKVGNTKRQINKPRPVSEDDMKAIFTQVKEEQLKADQDYLEMEGASDPTKISGDTQSSNEDGVVGSTKEPKPEKRSSKASTSTTLKKVKRKLPTAGSTVRVVSGPFADFPGILKKIDRKNGKASVGFTLLGKETIADGFTLLGKETIADVDIEHIEAEVE